MKYFFIATIALLLLLLGAGTLPLNSDTEVGTNSETMTSNESVAPEASTVQSQTEGYEIDPSDLYTVTEAQLNEIPSQLTENEAQWLVLMREEEKLARDVYQTLGDMWGVRIFSNIASSEQTHTDAVKALLERYDIADPVTDDTPGIFTDPNIQKLYTDLIAQGAESLLAALIVGATIEDLDIHDLDQAIADTNQADIILVYQNLQKGSRNHMRAFVRQIDQAGGTYTPQYISALDYEAIIASPQERGRVE